MNIQGIGTVSAIGRGLDRLHEVLENGAPEPSMLDVPFQDDPFPVHAVRPETLKDPVLRRARRADRFSKMAALAAVDAVRDAETELIPERTGLVLGTAFGPHPTVFSFLDEILEFGDAGVSPTVFSHSVHNAAASYVSVAVGSAGPAITLTSFSDPFQQALLQAKIWLDQGVCDSVLAGVAEECGTVMDYIVSRKLPVADGEIKAFFSDDGPAVIPGEGAFFFLLSRDDGSVHLDPGSDSSPDSPDFWIADFESRKLPENVPVGCWSHLIGSTPASTALSCIAGALMIQKKTVYSQTDLLSADLQPPNKIGLTGHAARGGWLLSE